MWDQALAGEGGGYEEAAQADRPKCLEAQADRPKRWEPQAIYYYYFFILNDILFSHFCV